MLDFFVHLFDTSGFPPRWTCGTWSPGHGWLHIISDIGVWSAYVGIPCVLAFFVVRRKDFGFRRIFLLFGAFILACGTTHLMEAIIFWWPAYRLAGLIKLFTAIVSWGTLLALVPVTPKILAMRSPEELEEDIAERTHELALARGNLELKVQQRTAELTEVNARLQHSLEEKEILLKEIHHRVKNNLQVISSLLDLQSQHVHDPPTLEMFRDSQHRVRSMALIHERLYRSHDLARVDFAGYVESLASRLLRSYGDSGDVHFDFHVSPDVRLSLDSAVPCGLLLNELLSNCLKHAFLGRSKGKIEIDLSTLADGRILLRVADDGVGMVNGINAAEAETFGLQLVSMLVKQLKGTLEIEHAVGTAFRITFAPRNLKSPGGKP